MTAWATLRRVGTGTAAFLFLLFASPAFAQAPPTPPKPTQAEKTEKAEKADKAEKPTIAQLRSAAEAAEKSGDWEAAFTAYCHLFVADRNSPEIREKLNTALRRVQQLRRHRDPQFQDFAKNTSVSDATKLFGEVLTKVPVFYVERE